MALDRDDERLRSSSMLCAGWLSRRIIIQRLLCHLRPTTPIRPPDLVDRSVAILLAHPEATRCAG